MASRILGMGDMLTLIEKAAGRRSTQRRLLELATETPRRSKLTLSDFYDQLMPAEKHGPAGRCIGAMMPGMNAGALKGAQVDEKAMARTADAIILSMTPYERENPSVLNSSRKTSYCRSAPALQVEDINKLLKQFDMMNQMMKQFSGPGSIRAQDEAL